jgi:hypothetical protein
MKWITRAVFFSAVLLSLCSLAAQEKEAIDLVNKGAELQLRLDGPFMNPFVGFGGELEFLDRAHRLDVLCGGSYGWPITAGVTPFGCEGFQAHASTAWMFADSVEWGRKFYAQREVARSSSTVTYSGFYYRQPSHTHHWAELNVSLEPCGVLAQSGLDPSTLEPIYQLEPGYAFMITPRYRIDIETRYQLEGYMAHPQGAFARLAVGPSFSPDCRRFGGFFDGLAGFNAAGFNMIVGVKIGFIARTDLQESFSMMNPDYPDYSTEKLIQADSFMTGYFPFRLSLGVSYNIPFGTGAKQ